MSLYKTICPYCTDGKTYSSISRTHLKAKHDKTIWDLEKDFPDFPKHLYMTNTKAVFSKQQLTPEERIAKQYLCDRMQDIVESRQQGTHCRFNETAGDMKAKIRRN